VARRIDRPTDEVEGIRDSSAEEHEDDDRDDGGQPEDQAVFDDPLAARRRSPRPRDCGGDRQPTPATGWPA
jgi:hypothetical protein